MPGSIETGSSWRDPPRSQQGKSGASDDDDQGSLVSPINARYESSNPRRQLRVEPTDHPKSPEQAPGARRGPPDRRPIRRPTSDSFAALDPNRPRTAAPKNILEFVHERWTFAEGGREHADLQLRIVSRLAWNAALVSVGLALAAAFFVAAVMIMQRVTGTTSGPAIGALIVISGLAGMRVVRRSWTARQRSNRADRPASRRRAQ
jgi:hypothetical protein